MIDQVEVSQPPGRGNKSRQQPGGHPPGRYAVPHGPKLLGRRIGRKLRRRPLRPEPGYQPGHSESRRRRNRSGTRPLVKRFRGNVFALSAANQREGLVIGPATTIPYKHGERMNVNLVLGACPDFCVTARS